MRRILVVSAALAGLLVVGVASAATASTQGKVDPEAAAALGMKVSLTEAIATAEQHTGGKAYDAGVDTDRGTTVVVETNGPKGVQTVTIDANSGKIVSEYSGGEQD